MLKIKNTKHLDTAEEVFTEFLDKFQKYAFEASEISKGKYNLSPADKRRNEHFRENHGEPGGVGKPPPGNPGNRNAVGRGFSPALLLLMLGGGLRRLPPPGAG